MSRIDHLIAEQCADGVEFKTLGDVLRIRNGKDHKHLGDGEIPVYGSGGIMRFADAAAAHGPSVLIPRKGSLGNVFYVEGPFWVVDTIFRTEIDTTQLEPKFLYHQLLTMNLGDMNQAGGVPSQTQSVLNGLRIPVPPLEVQREIVRILEEFTKSEADLEAELAAELRARRQQYEHYSERLFSPGFSEVEIVRPLGQVLTTVIDHRGKTPAKLGGGWTPHGHRVISALNIRNGAVDSNDHHYISAAMYAKWMSTPLQSGDVLLTSEAPLGSVAYLESPGPWAIGQRLFALRPDPLILNGRYLFHLLRSGAPRSELLSRSTGSTVSGIRQAELVKVEIPLPSLERQMQVARMLDEFDALVSDLSIGLPGEVDARRKQYEYYRDKLLTFDETPA